MIPSPWEFALLALAAFRVWKLIGDDAVLDRPRDRFLLWLEGKADDHWRSVASVDYFITCPWCAGFWIALAWWGAWLVWPYGGIVASVPFALSAVVGYLGVGIDSLEE